MTTYNIVCINNVNKDDYGKSPEKNTVWIEHDTSNDRIGGITVYESKEAVEKAWRRVFHIETNSPVKRIYSYGSWTVLLDEHEENIIRRATRMHVEN